VDLLEDLVNTNTLPSPPGIALEIIRLNSNEEVSISELAGVISRDPSIAAKLLRMANSSQIGRPGQVADLEDAIMVLGIRTVNLLALSFSLVSCDSSARSECFDYARFWTQSSCNAVAASSIAKLHAPGQRDEAFLSGLLCDFAQLMLAEVAPREYEPVVRWMQSNEGLLQQIEVSQLDYDHAQFGQRIFGHWGLPGVICDAIGAHHDPSRVDEKDEKARKLAEVLHIASTCSDLYVGHGPNRADELVALGSTYFGMSPESCQEILDQLQESVPEFLEILDLDTSDQDEIAEIRSRASEMLVSQSLELNQRVQSISGTLERLSHQNAQLEKTARTDTLTGLHNRLFLEEALERELDNAAESDGSVGLLLIDLDRFKQINDLHGHLAGDSILREVATLIKDCLTFGQTAIRCGGDEFIVLCSNVTPETLLERAQLLRRAVEETSIRWGSARAQPTLSIGGSVVRGDAAAGARTRLLESADAELYRAKAKGRNRVFVTTLKAERT
jgi:diguanylate cyclase (GGDEF)-like protein